MVLPREGTPSPSTTSKKPSSYNSLKYSPPKKSSGKYVVSQQPQPIRNRNIHKSPNKSPTEEEDKFLAQPENFELTSSSGESGKSAGEINKNKNCTSNSNTKVRESSNLFASNFGGNCNNVTTNTTITDTNIDDYIDENDSSKPLMGRNNVKIVSNSNYYQQEEHVYVTQTGNGGVRGDVGKEKAEDGCKEKMDTCLFSCFECLFVAL